MTDTRHFFITGPPRSGTTWLANLLTDHDTICFHELARQTGSAESAIDRLKTEPRAFVGDCGPLVEEYSSQLRIAFPHAKWVQVCPTDTDGIGLPNTLYVPHKKQFEEGTAHAIWRHCCDSLPWDADRFKILSQMRITTLEEQAVREMHPELRRNISRASQTPLHTQYTELIRLMCGQRVDAYQWIMSVLDLALTWDHLVDGDPLDVELAERTFESMLCQWPANGFYRESSLLLAPILSNCISAWRSGGRCSEYDIYTELPAAVAFLIGGCEWRDQCMTKIRTVVKNEIMADNTRDTQ